MYLAWLLRSFRKEGGNELEGKEAEVSVSARLERSLHDSVMCVRGVAELKAILFSQGEIAIRALFALLCFSLLHSFPPSFPAFLPHMQLYWYLLMKYFWNMPVWKFSVVMLTDKAEPTQVTTWACACTPLILLLSFIFATTNIHALVTF